MRALLVAAAFLAFAPTAFAADGAQSRALGYSPDAKYFAFEQYGTQDGSGYAYADIFVLDTSSNSWVKGSPFRVLDENESDNIVNAMAKADALAAPLLKSLKIAPAFDTLVQAPFTEIIADRRKAKFARYYDSVGNPENYEATGAYVLEARDATLPRPAECAEDDGYTVVGLELVLTNLKTGASTSLSKDATIPKSRYCPHAYDIEAIYAPSAYGLKVEPMVAIIGYYSRGFEGSDRRFIAMPFELTE